MTNRLGLGFLGGGINSAVGYAHFAASRLDGRFELSGGFFSRDPTINRDSGARYGISPKQVFESREDMLSRLDPSETTIVVLTPTPSHFDDIRHAIEMGFSVISEKALSTSSKYASSLGELAVARGKDLFVTMNYSGYPAVRELRKMIELGRLGEIRRIEIHMDQEGYTRHNASVASWRKKDYEIPSVSLDLGVHVHHLLMFLVPEIKYSLAASGYANIGILHSIVDTVWTQSESSSTPYINLSWSKTSMGKRNGLYLEIHGKDATAEWRQTDPEVIYLSEKNGERRIIDRSSPGLLIMDLVRYNRFKAGHPAGFIEAFANYYFDLAECLQANPGAEISRSYAVDFGLAVEGLRFLEAVDEFARS